MRLRLKAWTCGCEPAQQNNWRRPFGPNPPAMTLRNIIWNLLGLGIPLLVAVAAIPILLANIGAERFGFLGLAWGLVGYASILDFGMSRALTQKLAQNRNGPDEPEARSIVKSALALTLLVSAAFMLGMMGLAWFGVDGLISARQTPAHQISLSVLILAVTLPLQAVSMAYKGVNEAYLNFRGISLVRIFLGVANFGAPCALSFFTVQLHLLVLTLLVARLLALGCYFILARRCLPTAPAGHKAQINLNHTRALLRFGGWVALSGAIAPFLMQADRFVIAALISAEAVTSYVLPYEMVTQTLVLVGAITTIAFPVISQMIDVNRDKAYLLFRRWTVRITLMMLVVQSGLFIGMPIILNLWIGPNATNDAVMVGRILCAGTIWYTIGTMCTSYLHAHGKSRITTLLQLIEIPAYLALLYVLVTEYGVIGAAVAWSLRVAVDTVLLGGAIVFLRNDQKEDLNKTFRTEY